jgi:hypothetical protein
MSLIAIVMKSQSLLGGKTGSFAAPIRAETRDQIARVEKVGAEIASLSCAKVLCSLMNAGEMPWDNTGIFIDGCSVLVPAAPHLQRTTCGGFHHAPRCLAHDCHHRHDPFTRMPSQIVPDEIKRRLDWEALVQDISDGLEEYSRMELRVLEVSLLDKEGRVLFKGGVHTVLNFIVNDVFYDEVSNWEKAFSAKVGII